MSFVGDLNGENPMGKGVFFEEYEFRYQGKWTADQDKYTEEPANPMRFTSFDPLDNQVVVDEGAQAQVRMNKAYDSGFAFLAAAEANPKWRDYGAENPATRKIRGAWEAYENGGGALTGQIMIQGEPLYTPLAEEFWTVMDRLAEAAYDGHELGGYIKLDGISMGVDPPRYADLWLYCTAGEQGYAYLRGINGTDQRTASDPAAWADIAEFVTGLARVVVYEERVNPYASALEQAADAGEPEYFMAQMFEGAIKKGRVNAKFGRVLTRAGDNFIGYLTGDPVTGEWGAIGKGVWYSDLELKARGVWNTTTAAGLPFDAATDREDLYDFVCWPDMWNFEREEIPRHVLREEESGCRWFDGTCLYWAYQHNDWGAAYRLPAAIRESPYYKCAGAEEVVEEENDNTWEEVDFEEDDWDFEKEEEWTDEDWAEYEVDYDDIDFDDYGFDFEEDFGFYDLAGEADVEGDATAEWEDYTDEYDFESEDSNWTRPSDEFEDFGFDEWEEDPDNYDWDSDENWNDDGAWTDDYGQEYHNYTYEGEEEGSGYQVTEYTDEWGTTYREIHGEDGSYSSEISNEQEGWSEYYSQDRDGLWFSEYQDGQGYWSMNTFDPTTGRSIFQSGEPDGSFSMTVEEEDGTFTETRENADGSMETTRYLTDGSMVREVVEADGTRYNEITDWEGTTSREDFAVDDSGNEIQEYTWTDDDGRTYRESWGADNSAQIEITNPDGTREVQIMDAEGNTRIEHYDTAGAITREETIGYYQLDDGTFVVYREDTTGALEETYFREDGTSSTVRFNAEGEMVFEERYDEDGTRTVVSTRPDGTEVYETEDMYGITTIHTWNPETQESTFEYGDEYGNWIRETFDETNGELVRYVEDPYGTVFVERYDDNGDLVGDVVRQDREGFAIADEVVNDDGTITVTKEREDDAGNTITVVETWDPATGEASVTITDADGNTNDVVRDWEGNTIISDSDDGSVRTISRVTPEGMEQTVNEFYADE